ncbi:MAG TPA: hypothetical protein VNF04_01625 [Stellaceae bacterium]|nr:hypothetical protein [Stellaceae bacterium]
MTWDATGLWWLPTAFVAAITALGLIAAARTPSRPAKKYWIAALLAGGAIALGASAGQQEIGRAVLRAQSARARQLDAGLVAANARLQKLETEARALREKLKGRTLDRDVAAKMADYLHQAGTHRVVVSCIPDDVEAFDYANQIANALRAAGWEATGPEATSIFGNVATMGVKLYVRSGAAPPAAAKILIDGFTRFNIPFESGIAPSDAIPDPETTELFVSRKP